MVKALYGNRNTSPLLSRIRQAAQEGPDARRRGTRGHTPKAGRRRTRSVRRSDERPRQRRRWAFFSTLLPHLDIPAGTFLRALLAALAELQLDPSRLPSLERLDHGLVLAVLPAVVALEAQAAAHAALGLRDGLLAREARVDLPVRFHE